jgi:hypothetical protein
VPYSGGDGLTGRVGRTASGYDSQAVSEGRHGADSSLTWEPACVRALNVLVGEWVWERRACESPSSRARRGIVSTVLCPSSEAEFHPRGVGVVCSGGPLRSLGSWTLATGL